MREVKQQCKDKDRLRDLYSRTLKYIEHAVHTESKFCPVTKYNKFKIRWMALKETDLPWGPFERLLFPEVGLGPLLMYESSRKDASVETKNSVAGTMVLCVTECCLQLCVCFMYN